MGKTLFSGGTVVTAEGSYKADVLVENEKIVAVAPGLDANGAETVDASGKIIMPGFIDAHTDPELSTTATGENRHGNVDYTPYEGIEFHSGPAVAYVRGGLVYRDGEVVGEWGSGRFVERSFTATEGLEVLV